MNQESYRRMWDFYFEKYHYTCKRLNGFNLSRLFARPTCNQFQATKRSKLKRETEERAQTRKTKRRVPVPPIYRPRKQETNF